MLRNINSLLGFHMGATDDEIGKVKDFYFDDESWTVRYLVVKTGNWFSDKKVLISPAALDAPDYKDEVFPTSLTTEQIKNSPDIDTDKPVYRQHETELNQYYSWPHYWGAGFYGGGMGGMVTPATDRMRNEDALSDTSENDQHLRSADEVDGYKLHTTDGEIGHVKDFIVDDESWEIRFLVVDTGGWMGGKKVLISPQWIQEVQWRDSSVQLDLTKNEVKNSPEYDESKPVNTVYEKKLYKHYGRVQEHHHHH